jgi:hypothetical protein
LTGALSSDRGQVAHGETARLALSVTGGECLFSVEQPTLPRLTHFNLLGTAQRNEVDLTAGGPRFSTTFIYTLRAVSPGQEAIAAIQVAYREKEQGERRTLTVPGITLVVQGRSRAVARTAVVVLFSCAGAAVFIMLRRRRAQAGAPAPSVAAEGPPGAGVAAAALARIEDARRLRTAGKWGAYGDEVLSALSEVAGREPSAGCDAMAADLRGFCERVRYAGDESAERGIEECVRKIEVFLKEKIRDSMW